MLNALRRLVITAALMPVAAGADTLVDVVSETLSDSVPLPMFKVDAGWPRLPDDWIIGQAPGLAVDREDTIWVLHRPNSLGGTETGLDKNPPIAQGCCHAAPHVLRFDQDGELLSAWGGPEFAPTIDGVNQWPANVHGLYVDADGEVWIGGNGDDDHVVLNLTAEGAYIRQFGRRGVTEGNASAKALGNPADIADNGNTVRIADGYINKRIVQLAEADLSHSYSWGAYGMAPDSATREGNFDQSQATSNKDGGADPAAKSFGDIVHCVVNGPDNTIYVCDRRNNRVQLFRETPEGVEFVQNIVIAPDTGGTRTASDVAFSPDGKYVYIADMMNGKVWILLRKTHEILGSFGRNGRYPGQFIWLHSVDVDSHGNVYTTEVNTGRRVQRFVFQGYE